MFKRLIILLGIISLTLPLAAGAAYQYDLGLRQDDIRIVGGQIIAGKTMNVVARIHNYGEEDVVGEIYFYFGSQVIGEPAVMQVLSGTYDDAWVEFKVPESSFNIRVVAKVRDHQDLQPNNNESQTGMLYPDWDTDKDGIGNQQDADDDNDGLLDVQETGGINGGNGTDPLKADTDGDGHSDQEDAYPLDPAKWQKEAAVVKPAPVVPARPLPEKIVPTKNSQENSDANSAVGNEPEKTNINTSAAADGSLEKFGSLKWTAAGSELDSVGIIYQRVGGQKYKFQTDLSADSKDSYTYLWDFGDGSQSAESLAVHRYRQAGDYLVKLMVETPTKQILSSEVNLTISWLNPGNFKMWSLIFILCAIMIGLLLVLRLKSKNDFRRRTAAENLKNNLISLLPSELEVKPSVLVTPKPRVAPKKKSNIKSRKYERKPNKTQLQK